VRCPRTSGWSVQHNITLDAAHRASAWSLTRCVCTYVRAAVRAPRLQTSVVACARSARISAWRRRGVDSASFGVSSFSHPRRSLHGGSRYHGFGARRSFRSTSATTHECALMRSCAPEGNQRAVLRGGVDPRHYMGNARAAWRLQDARKGPRGAARRDAARKPEQVYLRRLQLLESDPQQKATYLLLNGTP
jgi:hypothetical protein